MTVMVMFTMTVTAQSMTYNHDASVMNQFTIGEVGLGSFTPDLYYDTFHKNYRNGAMKTNKQLFRTQMLQTLTSEVDHAEALDSALTERMRVESKNIADRTSGATDAAWLVERNKIESKLGMFKNNIERLTMEGASASVYRSWLERYNCINCGLQAVRDAYMPQGNRKDQYIAIYKDILLQNTEVCEYLQYLRAVKSVKQMNDTTKRLPRVQFGSIARSAHGRWKIALSASSGSTGTKE